MTHPNPDTSVSDAEWKSWMNDAIEEVHFRWTLFADATTPVEQAYALTKLNDAISDLSSYHTSYDPNTGTLGWQQLDYYVD
jgi:hypothetical protein